MAGLTRSERNKRIALTASGVLGVGAIAAAGYLTGEGNRANVELELNSARNTLTAVAPTETPEFVIGSPTPYASATAQEAISLPTETATSTIAPTDVPTETPTTTPTPTPTPTPTATETLTLSPSPSAPKTVLDTATPIPTATVTETLAPPVDREAWRHQPQLDAVDTYTNVTSSLDFIDYIDRRLSQLETLSGEEREDFLHQSEFLRMWMGPLVTGQRFYLDEEQLGLGVTPELYAAYKAHNSDQLMGEYFTFDENLGLVFKGNPVETNIKDFSAEANGERLAVNVAPSIQEAPQLLQIMIYTDLISYGFPRDNATLGMAGQISDQVMNNFRGVTTRTDSYRPFYWAEQQVTGTPTPEIIAGSHHFDYEDLSTCDLFQFPGVRRGNEPYRNGQYLGLREANFVDQDTNINYPHLPESSPIVIILRSNREQVQNALRQFGGSSSASNAESIINAYMGATAIEPGNFDNFTYNAGSLAIAYEMGEITLEEARRLGLDQAEIDFQGVGFWMRPCGPYRRPAAAQPPTPEQPVVTTTPGIEITTTPWDQITITPPVVTPDITPTPPREITVTPLPTNDPGTAPTRGPIEGPFEPTLVYTPANTPVRVTEEPQEPVATPDRPQPTSVFGNE